MSTSRLRSFAPAILMLWLPFFSKKVRGHCIVAPVWPVPTDGTNGVDHLPQPHLSTFLTSSFPSTSEFKPCGAQIMFELRGIFEMQSLQTAAGGALDVQLAVIDKEALFRPPLAQIERQSEDFIFRLLDSQEAGTQEDAEILPQTKTFDSK